jgi:hypothetical protein
MFNGTIELMLDWLYHKDVEKTNTLSTLQMGSSLCLWSSTDSLVQGPTWNSFEGFREHGLRQLKSIPKRSVATLHCKSGSFRILREDDFQWLVGIASEVARVRNGFNVALSAARVAIQHPDEQHLNLFIDIANTAFQSPLLPYKEGHQGFQLSSEELAAESADDFDPQTANIPRPKW